MGRLCAHTAVERRESLTSFIVKSIKATWFGVGVVLGSGFWDCRVPLPVI